MLMTTNTHTHKNIPREYEIFSQNGTSIYKKNLSSQGLGTLAEDCVERL